MEHDLVVFVPGFLGTRLYRDGQDVWARCSERLIDSAATALTEASLPPGLGDALPDAPHRLDAEGLLQVPDSVPGLLSCLGYPDLRAALGDPPDAQFVPFGYDWRLSHRLVARQLKERVARELDRWRAEADARHPDRPDDPRVILVCHGTGGLAGRHYLECEGGRDTARALITLGTPQQGLVQAARVLAGQAVPGDAGADGDMAARLNEALRAWALNLPAVAELLPNFRAVRVEGGARERTITQRPVPGLPGEAVQQMRAFQEEFRLACDRNGRSGTLPYDVHCLGSVDFPTPETLVLPAGPGGEGLADDLLGPGDGTVPRRSALADWTGTDPMLWTGVRNADLASAPALRDTMLAVRRGLAPDGSLAGPDGIVLHFPRDPVAAGRPFVIELLGHDLPQRDLRTFMWRSGRVREKQPVVFEQYEPDRYRAELEAAPGRWVVEAQVDRPKGRDRKDVTVVAV
ncbi:esterase/lipase family protein [Streptomyces pseudogriseolus]|uniref:esterase/lipase family protein n=1 Tax=Streptomyces pseudogriseolus TaxID=36817 RepID=UPI003FA23AE4